VLRRYFSNLDGPVFALVNLPEVVKGALFARYSRSAKSLASAVPRRVRRRARHQRRRDGRRDDRDGARRAALRPGLLRVRRRQRRPARRGAPGLRAGLEPAHQDPRVGSAHVVPGAVDPLHPLRRRLGGRYRYHRDPEVLASNSAPATSATWTGSSTPTPSWPPRSRTTSATATRRASRTPTSSTARRSGRRPSTPPAASCRPLAVERRHLRLRPGLRGAAAAHALAPAARGPPVRRPDADRAAQGDPELPAAGRPARPGWPGRTTWPTPQAMETTAYELLPGDEVTAPRRRR
jgi:hypothetical protein